MASDAELLKCARGWRRGMLSGPPFKGSNGTGLCFAIVAPLTGFLNACGIACASREGTVELPNETWQHFWIELPDGRILDPTASQFNGKGMKRMPAVYLGPRPTHYTLEVLAHPQEQKDNGK